MTKHILITDSGVGGLSVCAYAERFVRTLGAAGPVRLTFANAAPANDYGYNSMPSRAVKLETFDRFLTNVTRRYRPDMIYVACNTLSVLLPDTAYMRDPAIPVKGIVETAVDLVHRELQNNPDAVAMIFGTQTTIDSGVYPAMLEARGVGRSRIISQACPGLADTISEDREGTKTRSEIEHWTAEAIGKTSAFCLPPSDLYAVACLACTHYGYRKDDFAEALAAKGVRATVVNPNERAVDDLFTGTGTSHDVSVEFVTRYPIPAATVEALTWFLEGISPRTVAAMRDFVHVSDLF